MSRSSFVSFFKLMVPLWIFLYPIWLSAGAKSQTKFNSNHIALIEIFPWLLTNHCLKWNKLALSAKFLVDRSQEKNLILNELRDYIFHYWNSPFQTGLVSLVSEGCRRLVCLLLLFSQIKWGNSFSSAVNLVPKDYKKYYQNTSFLEGE